MPELYLDILRTSFLANLALPISHEVPYYAALCFGVGSSVLLFFVALVASLPALGVNVAVGAVGAEMNMMKDHPTYQRVQRFLQRWLVWLLLIPGNSLHGLLVAMMGVAGVRWQRLLLVGAIEHALRYAITAFYSHSTAVVSAFF